jgi:putative resolvase
VIECVFYLVGLKLTEWACSNGVHLQTAYRWFRKGKMSVAAPRLVLGTIWVESAQPETSGRTVTYARVSSPGQRADLDRQVARLTRWAASNGHEVGEVATEVGSGLKGKRPKLRRVLSNPTMCAGLYGRGGARNRVVRAVTAARREPGEAAL